MRDFITGILIGAFLTGAIFVYAGQTRKIDKLELTIQSMVIDIERITQKIGPLPEKVKKK